MKKDIIALTNAVTDVFIHVTDSELERIGLKKGSYNSRRLLYENPDFLSFMEKNRDFESVPGGSPANLVHNAAVLGLKNGLFGTVGNDMFGKKFRKDLKKHGLEDCLTVIRGEKSGVCYLFITPDGEKTMITNINAAKQLSVDLDKINEYRIFHTSGYEMNSDPKLVIDAMRYAKSKDVKTSFDMADPVYPKKMRESVDEIISVSDYLAFTESELRTYAGIGPEDNLPSPQKIREMIKGPSLIAVKKGGKGSELITRDEHIIIPRCSCRVINTTGAGDTYLAGILYGILKGFDLESAGRTGSYFASLVCSQESARLEKPARRH
jgi:sugar/nucleoside kinase (ribokinase family)